MCHTSGLKQQSEQIERFVENGMPVKLVKKVNSLINRKRRLENRKNPQKNIFSNYIEYPENEEYYSEDIYSNTNSNFNSKSNSNSSDEIENFYEEIQHKEQPETTKDSTTKPEIKSDNETINETVVEAKIHTENETAIETKNESDIFNQMELSIAPAGTDASLASSTLTKDVTTSKSTLIQTEAPATVAAPVPAQLRKVLTCPFTSNKRIINASVTEAEEKQKIMADIASFHFKERKNSLSSSSQEPELDMLGTMTQYSKHFFFYIGDSYKKFQHSRFYTFVTQKPQPFTVLGLVIMTYIVLALGPDLRGNHQPHQHYDNTNEMRSSSNMKIEMKDGSSSKSSHNHLQVLATISYLALFATHFGAQIWMTFVSGLSLYFNLPRHVFGQCQQILFPRYFLFNGILSTIMLLLYVKFFISSWSLIAVLQVVTLGLTALIEFIVRLYLAPPMLLLMHEKYKIEETVGSGSEIGMVVQGDLAQCPHYQRIHKAFRRSHMMIAICNMTILMFTIVTLFSLACKIQIS